MCVGGGGGGGGGMRKGGIRMARTGHVRLTELLLQRDRIGYFHTAGFFAILQYASLQKQINPEWLPGCRQAGAGGWKKDSETNCIRQLERKLAQIILQP